MQNNSTGMLATSVPVGVVPSAPRWPSWNIHTNAPKAAVNDKTLSTNDFSGNTTLPVSRNSSTNVIAAMIPRTVGSREGIACELSRLIWATPVSCTDLPAGALAPRGRRPPRPAIDERGARRRHRRHIRHLRQRRGVAVEVGGRDSGGVGDDH